ncbi:hypothetical protein OG542_38400 [Streptomyces violaceus]|uniref:hypothetical protein n=1 Tax=Streptomyces violaceus TaxID=1936 RepID=UPI002E23336A
MPGEEAGDVIETEPGWCAIVVGTGKPARGSGTLGGRPTIVEEILELQVALSGGVDESVSVAVEQEQLTLRAHRHERLVQIPAVPPRSSAVPVSGELLRLLLLLVAEGGGLVEVA